MFFFNKGNWKLSVVILSILVICPLAPAGAADRDTLVVGINADMRTPELLTTMDQTSDKILLFQIYEPLMARNRQMVAEPWLAESLEPSGELNWKLTLRKGVKFHNGAELTADDVKYTLDWILNPQNASMRLSRIELLEKVEKTGTYELNLVTKKPFPVLPVSLGNISIIPQGMTPADLAENPVGTGPYKFKEWKKERSIVFTRFDGYWSNAPYFKTIEFLVRPEVGARLSALLAGEVDMIPDVPVEMVPSVNANPATEIRSVPAGRSIGLYFNLVGNPDSVFHDIRMRKALNYAVNVREITQHILSGFATPTGPLVPMNRHHYPEHSAYPYDPEKAVELIKRAGYEPGDLHFTLHSPKGRYLKDFEAAQAIGAQLEKIGIKVDVVLNEWGHHLELMKKCNSQLELFINGRGERTFEGSMMQHWFKSGMPWHCFSDEEVDAAIDEAMPIVDPDKREKAMMRLEGLIWDKAPWVFLWAQNSVWGVKSDIDWSPWADEIPRFATAARK